MLFVRSVARPRTTVSLSTTINSAAPLIRSRAFKTLNNHIFRDSRAFHIWYWTRAAVRTTISRVGGDLLRHAYICTAANRELYISSVNSVLPTHVWADNRYCLIFRSLCAFFFLKKWTPEVVM